MSNIFLDAEGKTVVVNEGPISGVSPTGYAAHDPVVVPVIPAGSFPLGVRVAQVRMLSGKIETFGGDLLKEALANGGKLVKILREGK